MDVKRIFEDCSKALESYKSAVNSALADYHGGSERAVNEASAFKDERAELAKRKTALLNTARAEIRRADAELHNRVSGQIPKLREALSAYITAKPDPNFMEMLRDVKTFRLTLSRSELEALIPSAEGNFTALKALQSVANDNGYTLTAPDIAAFLYDVKALERAVRVPVMYAGEYVSEAAEVLDDRPVFRGDGSVAYSTGRPDALYLIMRGQELDGLTDSLAEVADRWSGSFVPQLSDLEPIQLDDGDVVTPEQQREAAISTASERISVDDSADTERAAAMGAERAEADRKAMETLQRYYIH